MHSDVFREGLLLEDASRHGPRVKVSVENGDHLVANALNLVHESGVAGAYRERKEVAERCVLLLIQASAVNLV